MSNFLVVVDVQNDFCEGTPGIIERGSLAVAGGNDVAAKIMGYVAQSQRGDEGLYRAVYTTQDWHVDPGNHWSETPDFVDSWPVHCAAGTPGAALHPAIEAVSSLITSRHFKGMYEAAYSGTEAVTPMNFWGADEIHVVGLALDYCVYQTARDIARQNRDAAVTIITDLSAAINYESVVEQATDNDIPNLFWADLEGVRTRIPGAAYSWQRNAAGLVL